MACIFLTIFIRNIELKDTELKKYYSFMIVVIILIAVNKGYSKITSVIGLEYRKQLTNFVTDIREDKSNTYITNNTTFLKRNLPFNIVDKGSLQNCMIANNDYILYNKKQKYMEEPIELVNNTNIRLLSTSYANDISKYLNKAYDAKTYVVQIGNLYNTSICMLRRGLPKLDTDSIKKAKSDIKMNIEIEDSKGDEESKVLNGYIYKNNTDSFAQKVYIEAYNRKDKIYTYYDVIQTENARCTDKMKGKFSAFSVEIPLSKMENYSVILEVDGTMYRVNINERW